MVRSFLVAPCSCLAVSVFIVLFDVWQRCFDDLIQVTQGKHCVALLNVFLKIFSKCFIFKLL